MGGEGEIYGESNMETYITICKIDSQREFAVWLRKLKQGLCINLDRWDEEADRREVQKTGDIRILMADSSGGDGIPVELFQILKDDAMKVLHSICQQIWKTQQWPQDWKRSVFIPIPKKGNAKECLNYRTIALISHARKVILKILQARLLQYVNHEIPDVQAGFRKGRGTGD